MFTAAFWKHLSRVEEKRVILNNMTCSNYSFFLFENTVGNTSKVDPHLRIMVVIIWCDRCKNQGETRWHCVPEACFKKEKWCFSLPCVFPLPPKWAGGGPAWALLFTQGGLDQWWSLFHGGTSVVGPPPLNHSFDDWLSSAKLIFVLFS